MMEEGAQLEQDVKTGLLTDNLAVELFIVKQSERIDGGKKYCQQLIRVHISEIFVLLHISITESPHWRTVSLRRQDF